MAFDYFYGAQSQQFAFYRIPKVLFTDNRFQKISTEGKVLYGLLLDRVSLSMENGWIDDEGRVYIIFTLTTIRQAMNCAEKSAIKYLTELEEFGLIERIRQGFGKPALIYVKNFIDQQNLQVKTSKNYSSPPVKVTGQDLYNLQPNYTYNNNTDFNNTNPILSEDEDRMGYEKYFMEQLNIEALKQDYPYDREMIDGIMELILDVVCSKRKTICIAGDVKSVNVVKGRFMKLNMEHIRYVMNCMQENTTKIRSIKQYMLAALYNAPATIDSYYRAEVNHDMAEEKYSRGETKMDMEKIMAYVEKIAENLEGLVCAIGCDSMPSDGAIYVDGEQKVNYISTREALRILDGFGNNSASVMIGKSDYILIYDASRKLVIDGEAYLPSGYLVMKSCNGLQAIDDEDFADVIAALKSRMTMLALGKYRIQAYQLG